MICEPNFHLPQQIDLDSIRKSQETSNDATKPIQNSIQVKHKVSYEQKEYNMLPLFNDQFDHLNSILSLKSNKFLACRWNSFLDSVPEKYIRIRLYVDHKKSLE